MRTSFPKFCSPVQEAVSSHSPSRGSRVGQHPSPAGQPVAGGWSNPISLLRGPGLFTVDPLSLKHQLFKAFKTSQSATLPTSSRFHGGPRTLGAGPSSHLGGHVTRPVWALTAPGHSPPFIRQTEMLLFPASVFLCCGAFGKPAVIHPHNIQGAQATVIVQGHRGTGQGDGR